MPDDQQLQIHITSDADLKGFNQAATASKTLKVDTSNLSDETKRALGILPALEDNLKKGGKAAAESGLSNRELHHVLMDIGNVSAPGAGRALSALAFGPVGAALALVGLYEMLKKKLDEVGDDLDKIESENFEAHRRAIEALKKAWEDALAAEQAYQNALKDAAREKDPAAARLAEIKAISDAQTAANIKHLQQLAQIRIAYLQQNGGTPEQISAVETATAAAIDHIKTAGTATDIAAIKADIAARKERQSDYDSTEAAEGERVARAKVAQDAAHRDFETANDPKLLATADAEVTAAQQKLDGIRRMARGIGIPEADVIKGSAPQQAALDAANANVENIRKAIKTAEEKSKSADAELRDAEAAHKDVAEKGVANKAAITREEREVHDAEALLGVTAAAQQTTEALAAFAAALDIIKGKNPEAIAVAGAAAAEDIEAAARAGLTREKIKADYTQAIADQNTPGAFVTQADRDAIARYQRLAADDTALADFRALLTSLGDKYGSIMDIVNQELSHHISQGEEIRQLREKLRIIEAQNQAHGVQIVAMPWNQY